MCCVFAWGMAAEKSISLWADWKRRAVILVAIASGQACVCHFISMIARAQLPGLPGVLIVRETIGYTGLFFTLYHVLMVYIKVLRLHLTRRVGDKK
jgi:hypothetical protein